jgi:toxin ParE1/3/4
VTLRWASPALQEAEAIVEYYEQRRVGLGNEFALVLGESLQKIKAHPAGFSLLETLPTELGYRRLRMPQFPYLIVFRHSREMIEIIAITHTSREPNYWRNR